MDRPLDLSLIYQTWYIIHTSRIGICFHELVDQIVRPIYFSSIYQIRYKINAPHMNLCYLGLVDETVRYTDHSVINIIYNKIL